MSANSPVCAWCGSANITKPGFISFHWRKGRWVTQRGSAELADTDCFNCPDCGQTSLGNFDPPFDLEKDNRL